MAPPIIYLRNRQIMDNKFLSGRAIVLGLCLLSLTSAQTVSPSPTNDTVARLQAELEPKIKAEIQQGHLPGFAIGVIRNGKLIYAKCCGVTELGSNPPITS